MDSATALELYRHALTARQLDTTEKDLIQSNLSAFCVLCAGHEATAALAPSLTADDWLCCHYRDRALLLARGLTTEKLLLTSLGRRGSDSDGRRMPGFYFDPTLNLANPTTLVGNNALQAVGVAARLKATLGNAIVYCGLGDGATQEGEFYEAVAEAAREKLPVLFAVGDNSYALSTPTRGRTFYSLPDGEPESFFGLPIQRLDGADLAACHDGLAETVAAIRRDQTPAVVVIDLPRLRDRKSVV